MIKVNQINMIGHVYLNLGTHTFWDFIMLFAKEIEKTKKILKNHIDVFHTWTCHQNFHCLDWSILTYFLVLEDNVDFVAEILSHFHLELIVHAVAG